MYRTQWELSEIPVGMRKYFEEFETKCGKAWVRVTETTRYEPEVVEVGVRNVDVSRGDKVRKLDGKSDEWKQAAASRQTLGFRVACRCEAGEPVPCVVLDPFLGSGTSLLVARQLGRQGIGIELNPKYADLAVKRLEGQTLSMFALEV
jgi:hypothetical protein